MTRPWAQQPGETDDEYVLFWYWYTRPSRQVPDDPYELELAQRYRWSDRALVLDTLLNPEYDAPESILTPLGEAARKASVAWQTKQAMSPDPVISIDSLLRIHDREQGAAAILRQEITADRIRQKLTTAEMEQFLEYSRRIHED